MPILKFYADVFVNTTTTPTNEQWHDLVINAKEKPMISAIIRRAKAAQNHIVMHKRSHGTGHENRHTILSAEISIPNRTILLERLNIEATKWGITGTPKQKFEGVFTEELREAATDIGFGAQASNISATIIDFGEIREDVEAVTQEYIETNTIIWHENN